MNRIFKDGKVLTIAGYGVKTGAYVHERNNIIKAIKRTQKEIGVSPTDLTVQRILSSKHIPGMHREQVAREIEVRIFFVCMLTRLKQMLTEQHTKWIHKGHKKSFIKQTRYS